MFDFIMTLLRIEMRMVCIMGQGEGLEKKKTAPEGRGRRWLYISLKGITNRPGSTLSASTLSLILASFWRLLSSR